MSGRAGVCAPVCTRVCACSHMYVVPNNHVEKVICVMTLFPPRVLYEELWGRLGGSDAETKRLDWFQLRS